MEDTIAAASTAPGEGGIGIIRISGDKSLDILNRIFVRGDGENPLNEDVCTEPEHRKLYYGHIVDSETGNRIDEVLAVYMKAPHTYTKEDIVEIDCHGSLISLRKILELILKHGARLADKGEFTKRAFLNGRIDLSQAEAVMDMISAKTDTGFELAVKQLEGRLSLSVSGIRDDILQILAHVIVNLDYPDEDVEEISLRKLKEGLEEIRRKISMLLDTASTGRIIRDGLNTVIIGKPNVGKSSLMNALLRESRAIVTEIPGTTRDTIEEYINIKNIPIKLVDTAGIRETEDIIEKIGIEKSKESFNKADLVILILNAAEGMTAEDLHIISHIKASKTIVLLNKMDLGRLLPEEEIKKHLPEAKIIWTSIKDGTGIEALENEIVSIVYGGRLRQTETAMITNVRHMDLLEKAGSSIDDAIEMCDSGAALDFIEVDIRRAWEQLGEIIGETVAEDIIDEVFSRFCLGK